MSADIKKNLPLIFCFLLLLTTIFLSTLPAGGDYDVWWHLKYGEHFVQNLTFYIDHSAYSWTLTNPDWKYVTWVGSSLLYLVYKAGDFAGLCLLNPLISIMVMGTYLIYVKSINKRLEIHDIFCMLLVASLSNLPYVKPDLFTTLFFAFAVFIYFYSKTTSKSIFLLNVPLFLIWVNTHGGFIIGLFFLSLALTVELLNFYFFKSAPLSRRLIRDFALSVFLSYAILVFNPYGPEYFVSLSKDLFFSDYMNNARKLMAYLAVWKQLSPTSNFIVFTTNGWQMIVAMVLFLLSCAYAYSKNKKIDPAVLVTTIFFFFFGMMQSRAAKFFPILWLFSLAYVLYPLNMQLQRKKLSVISFILIILFASVQFKFVLTVLNINSYFSKGFNAWVPEKEVAFIKSHNLPGPIFNDYLTGGYMIWSMYPEYKVFIDPRYGPYTQEVLSDWFDFESEPTRRNLDHLAAKYKFNTAFINFRDIRIIKQFIGSPEWKLIYFDISAAVFVNTPFAESNEQAFRSVDLGAERFRQVDDPEALSYIFDIYNALAATKEMTLIRDIYNKNVRDYYLFKKNTLYGMDLMLAIRTSLPK